MYSDGGQKSVRKFPPPCWTRDEALVLIEAYRVRWYALHCAFLRTPDWDAVAETVTTTCPDVTPPKTSAQCRHKMEKLRQRHRAEKQRAAAFSGDRFFSTWFYYDAMETIENGSNTVPGNNPVSNPGHGNWVKPNLAGQSLTNLPPNSTKHRTKPNPNFGYNVSNRYSSSNQNDDYEQLSLVGAPIEETLIPTAYRGRDSKIQRAKNQKKSSSGSGITIKPSITPQQEPGFRSRKLGKAVRDDDGEMWVKVHRDIRGKWRNENDSIANGKKVKKSDGGIADVVTSIRLLGEGFMKVEKMKMDMVREIEKMRMETEMKRNELMIESQKLIVDAFVQGLIESRKVETSMANL